MYVTRSVLRGQRTIMNSVELRNLSEPMKLYTRLSDVTTVLLKSSSTGPIEAGA